MKVAVTGAVTLSFVAHGRTQSGVTDADLEAASGALMVRVGPAAGSSGGGDSGGGVATWPLEVYVARVLAGEAEPKAADAALEALAVAIRTFVLANPGRHAGDGFDLCDGTHCQVPRAMTDATRRARWLRPARSSRGNGAPAEVFYSASCGGYSESAEQVWPGGDYPYMQSAPDDVHDGDLPWTVDLTLEEVQRALAAAGFEGRLDDVEVDGRNVSGRVIRLRLAGLRPAVIAADRFRAAIGAVTLRSTAFSIDRRDTTLRFTGRGYGHGVGMCVIGAGRRAARGATARVILARYYPGLDMTPLNQVTVDTARAPTAQLPEVLPSATGRRSRDGIVVEVARSSGLAEVEVARLTARVHGELAGVLGTSVAPITVRVHASLESFRLATGRPWWVRSVSAGTSIDLVPAALFGPPDGFEGALRIAVAELLVSEGLRERPVWVRVGAARYFARGSRSVAPEVESRAPCPSDADLMLAVSASAQRIAEAGAEVCFAREYGRTRDWRAVR